MALLRWEIQKIVYKYIESSFILVEKNMEWKEDLRHQWCKIKKVSHHKLRYVIHMITIYDFVTFLSRRNSMYECDATAKVKFIAYFIPSQRIFFLNSRIVQVKRPTLITWGPWICNLNWLHGSHSSGTEITVSGLLTFENWPLLPHLILVDLNRCAHQTCKQFNWIKQHLTSFGGWHFDIGCD